MTRLYPLPLTFSTSAGAIQAVIDRDGWQLDSDADRAVFAGLPVPERLDLRRALAAQVDLAAATPAK